MAIFGTKRRNPALPDWYEQLFVGDPNAPEAGSPPMGDGSQPKRGGIFGDNFLGGGSWGDRLGNLASSLGAAGAYFDGDWQGGAAIGQARNSARDAALAAERKRQQDYEDYVRRKQYDAELEARKPPEQGQFIRDMQAAGIDPNSPEGQALIRQRLATQASPAPNLVGSPERGYQWVQPPAPPMPGAQAAPSQPKQDYHAPTPVGTVEDGMQFMGGDDTDQRNWKPVGGGVSNGTGNFPPYRR